MLLALTLRPRAFVTILCVLTVTPNGARGAIYTDNLVVQLRANATSEFFGYAVALQAGTPPRVIVGAPKEGPNGMGAVYVCSVAASEDALSGRHCLRYTIDQKHIGNTRNVRRRDSMFGACIDGGVAQDDEIMIGAPKLAELGEEVDFYKGGVFRLSQLERQQYEKLPEHSGSDISNNEYLYGVAQFGFAVHAINATEFLYGTPGFGHWRGDAWRALYATASHVPQARLARPPRARRALGEQIQQLVHAAAAGSALAGYAVTSGRFFGHTSYVVGLPNDLGMLGSVRLFAHDATRRRVAEERVVWPRIAERRMAEHFGAALLAADVNGDGRADLLVGAPNADAGEAFDNGKVYVLLSNGANAFALHQVLVGPPASRCGTSLANLGAITLDAFDSVAVGCPYESGAGAVRVYVWAGGRLTLDSQVALAGCPSFGYSLSRAVDVDANHVADLAVGAYQCNAVAILKAKAVFHYTVTTRHSTLRADRDDGSFAATVCVAAPSAPAPIDTEVTYEFDARIAQGTLSETARVSSAPPHCRSFALALRPNALRTQALSIVVRLRERTCDTCPVRSPTHPGTFDQKIPFQLDCRGAVCVPRLRVEAVGLDAVVVGAVAKLEFHVRVTNDGDPALACTIGVVPEGVSVPVRGSRCADACEVAYIIDEVTQPFTLDLAAWPWFSQQLHLKIRVACLNATVERGSSLRLVYRSDLAVERTQLTKQYDSLNASTFAVDGAAVIFHIRNDGPSRLQLANYVVRIPRYAHGVQLVDVYEPEHNEDCEPIEDAFDARQPSAHDNSANEPAAAGFGGAVSRENTISCDTPDVQCIAIQCRVRSLAKGDIHVLNFPIRLSIADILQHYRSTFSVVSTIQREDEDVQHRSALDIVDKQTVLESVAVWKILVSVLGGLLLLAALVATLYKVGFFSRPRHEKLMEEKEHEAGLEGVELRQPGGGDAATTDANAPIEAQTGQIPNAPTEL